MRRLLFVLAVCAIAFANSAISFPSAQERGSIGRPAWKQWWELQRPRLEWIQTGTICVDFPVPSRVPGPTDPLTGARLSPTARDRKAVHGDLVVLFDRETNAELLGCTMIALAKMGLEPTQLVERFLPFLSKREPELSEAAWIALAVLAEPSSASALREALTDSARGRELVGRERVEDRVRALAAYALARVAEISESTSLHAQAVESLKAALGASHAPMLEVACVQALGLVPLLPGETERFEILLAVAADATRSPYARGQAALALARHAGELEGEPAAAWKQRVGTELLSWIGALESPAALRRQSVLALGRLVASHCPAALVEAAFAALRGVVARKDDEGLAGYALLALAQASPALAERDSPRVAELARSLIAHLEPRDVLRPWAALACGRMVWGLCRQEDSPGGNGETLATLRSAIREGVHVAGPESEPFVIAADLADDAESYAWTIGALAGAKSDALVEEQAYFLGSVPRPLPDPEAWNIGAAREALRGLGARTTKDPETYRIACRSRARIDDPRVTDELLAELTSATNFARRTTVLAALGTSKDGRAVKPLLTAARDVSFVPRVRDYAIVALGELLDKEPRPWHTLFAEDLDPLDAPPTLLAADGTGLLNYR